jgi:hypothetical protein
MPEYHHDEHMPWWCSVLSNHTVHKAMNIAAYLNCYYFGIYFLCMSLGHQHAGTNLIHASFESDELRALAHVLYLTPFLVGTFVLFPAITRDSSMLQGLLKLNEEAAHHVEKVENVSMLLVCMYGPTASLCGLT